MKHGISEISKRFKAYNKTIMDSWEDYNFQNFYLDELHKLIKKGSISDFESEQIYSSKKKKYKNKDLFGVIDHLKKKVIPTRILFELVSLTESYLQEITYRIYRDFQFKLINKDETAEQSFKLLYTIVNSVDKDEIISKIAEEKIRGIFYGNPLDFYEKDKAKIGIENYFANNYRSALEILAEIIARRNIYTHNNGNVDRKYLKEVKNPKFKLEEKAIIDKTYAKQTVIILRGFAAVITRIVLTETYKAPTTNTLIKRRSESFEKQFKGK
jgi:hypothetical protein